MTTKGFTTLKTLSDIPKHSWNGYYRLSNAEHNTLISPQNPFDFNENQSNPFIIEANFYTKEDGGISIFIRNTDAKYFIGQVTWKEISDDIELRDLEYQGQGFQGSNKILTFKEAWEPIKDNFCAEMEVLKPAWIAFTGFKEENE